MPTNKKPSTTDAAATVTDSQSEAPVITAIEIENFKGVGRPVRIDVRPITLLFGRNSAGKSTILHALCYANEILNGQLDPHTTSLGGDELDLGGFHHFVHNHDTAHIIRLRFDLNLRDWTVHSALNDRLVSRELTDDEFQSDWWHNHDLAHRITSGWFELRVGSGPDQSPLVAYELGLNDHLVGHLQPSDNGRTTLDFNCIHPLLDLARDRPASPNSSSRNDGVRRTTVTVFRDLPVVDWNDCLRFDADALHENPNIDVETNGSLTYYQFQTTLSAMFIGIGHALKSELDNMRYIGPLRDPYPYSRARPLPNTAGPWANGTAAWDVLRKPPRHLGSTEDDLLQDVSNWLSRGDRLDTGYKLRRQLSVTIPMDDDVVKELQDYFRECWEQGNLRSLDLDRWADDHARQIVSLFAGRVHLEHDEIKTQIILDLNGHPFLQPLSDPDRESVDAFNNNPAHAKIHRLSPTLKTSVAQCVERYRERFGRLIWTDMMWETGGGVYDHTGTEVMRAISQPELQIVTATGGVPVRTSDIGIGVSQLVPVVVAALDPSRPAITAIEQPELHLHPKAQVELGDLFAHRRTDHGTFLIETHSEHLILRLLRRIEETSSGTLPSDKPRLSPDDVSVIYIEQVDGRTQATHLRVDATGEFLDRWPHGFFRERAAELI